MNSIEILYEKKYLRTRMATIRANNKQTKQVIDRRKSLNEIKKMLKLHENILKVLFLKPISYELPGCSKQPGLLNWVATRIYQP